MAYKKGTAYIDEDYWGDGSQAVMLPHSCDEWVIGGAKEIDRLIDDLTRLKEQLLAPPQVDKGEGV